MSGSAYAYELTLTREERKAFSFLDWRYAAGDVMDLLMSCEQVPEEAEWDDECDITFKVPENVAWQILELASQENCEWPCFSDTLALKMVEFCGSIV